MKIGIPRALLYYKNEKFWTTFFDEIGVEYIISPETDRDILARGENLAVDETCLPAKLFLGHVDWLIGKCDYIFVPRVAYRGGFELCTRFMTLPDLVSNIYRGKNLKLLFYNDGGRGRGSERKAVRKMGKYLGVKRSLVRSAYAAARQAQTYYERRRTSKQDEAMERTDKPKILVVAHAYNIGDDYIGKPVTETLKSLGCMPVIAEYADERECVNASFKISHNLPWMYNRHLLGAIELYRDKVDGIILFTTFPCGTDSMVNELAVRRYKEKPMIVITADSQDGTAGLETRLESFVDIIMLRRRVV